MSVKKNASKAVLVDGQDSIFRLLYAPFTFLSTCNEGVLAGMLASAVGFLEGYSSDALEAEATFRRDEHGAVVSRSQLKLVSYASPAAAHPLPSSENILVISTSALQAHAAPRRERRIVLEQRIVASVPAAEVTQEELDALKQCFSGNVLHSSGSFEILLQQTSSPAFTKLAVACYSQTGLAVSPASFKSMLLRVAGENSDLAKRIALDHEFEMDLTAFVDRLPADAAPVPLVAAPSRPLVAGKPRTSRPQQSRLERIRKKE